MYTLRQVSLVLCKIVLVGFAIFSVLLTGRLIIMFFGPALKEIPAGELIKDLAEIITLPLLKQGDIKTPYGGFFEINTCMSLLLYLLLEPVIERLRRAIENWSPKRIARD